jgi:uncharacterized protein
MECLRCSTPMVITEKKGIEIDYCPNCHGVWLDKGELDKIIEQFVEHYSDKKNYEDDYEEYQYGDPDFTRHHPNRKKKSFLNNFFDIE